MIFHDYVDSAITHHFPVFFHSVFILLPYAALFAVVYTQKTMQTDNSSNTIDTDLPVRIYAAGKREGIFATLKAAAAEFPQAHALGYRIAERNIKARYRQSMMGILWALLPPLATASVWIFLNQSNVIQLNSVGGNYALFAITGTMLWTVFSGSVMLPVNTVQGNTSILVKINFPREALLITAFYEVAFNTLISLAIIVLELLFFQVPLSYSTLLFLPSLVLLMLMAICVGLIILPVAMLYKDLQFLVPLGLQFAMYLTPVVYVIPDQGLTGTLLKLNPVSPVLSAARDFLLGANVAIPYDTLVIIALATIALLLIGVVLHRIAMEILIERMGS